MQQRPGITGKFPGGYFIGIAEKPAQPIQALLLFGKTLGDAAKALARQQLEALAQLLIVQRLRGQGQGGRQQAAGQQRNQGHHPGGHRLCAQARHPRKHATL